jgi:hypothetical protein
MEFSHDTAHLCPSLLAGRVEALSEHLRKRRRAPTSSLVAHNLRLPEC